MPESMTVDEMKQRFRSEWILVGDPVEDETFEVLGGHVLFHSPSADETYRKAIELRPGRFATIFTGELNAETEFAL